jgi:hypothetical protein
VETLRANNAPTLVRVSVEGMVEQLQARQAKLGLSYIGSSLQTTGWLVPVVLRLAGS